MDGGRSQTKREAGANNGFAPEGPQHVCMYVSMYAHTGRWTLTGRGSGREKERGREPQQAVLVKGTDDRRYPCAKRFGWFGKIPESKGDVRSTAAASRRQISPHARWGTRVLGQNANKLGLSRYGYGDVCSTYASFFSWTIQKCEALQQKQLQSYLLPLSLSLSLSLPLPPTIQKPQCLPLQRDSLMLHLREIRVS